jgi:iron complex transport system substrate-binding protein
MADGPVTVTDDAGQTVVLEQAAQRIVSLAPSMTELLFSLGAGDRIVGVMAHSDFPAQAAGIPVVGQHDGLDLEQILSLRPDLVVAWQTGNPRGALLRIQSLGIPVYIAEPQTLDDIAVQLEKLAALAGISGTGDELAAELRKNLDKLRTRYSGKESVDVFYQVWDTPLVTVGGNELINDVISLCGGRNIFRDLPVGPKVSVEAVIQRRPEVIVGSGVDDIRPEWLDYWQRWPRLPATEEDHVYHINPDIMQRHSLRALQGTRRLCELIDTAR